MCESSFVNFTRSCVWLRESLKGDCTPNHNLLYGRLFFSQTWESMVKVQRQNSHRSTFKQIAENGQKLSGVEDSASWLWCRWPTPIPRSSTAVFAWKPCRLAASVLLWNSPASSVRVLACLSLLGRFSLWVRLLFLWTDTSYLKQHCQSRDSEDKEFENQTCLSPPVATRSRRCSWWYVSNHWPFFIHFRSNWRRAGGLKRIITNNGCFVLQRGERPTSNCFSFGLPWVFFFSLVLAQGAPLHNSLCTIWQPRAC